MLLTNVTKLNCQTCPYWTTGHGMNGVMGACNRYPEPVSKAALNHACGEHPTAQGERACWAAAHAVQHLEDQRMAITVKKKL